MCHATIYFFKNCKKYIYQCKHTVLHVPPIKVYYADFNPYQPLSSPKVNPLPFIISSQITICVLKNGSSLFHPQSDASNQSFVWPDKPVRNIFSPVPLCCVSLAVSKMMSFFFLGRSRQDLGAVAKAWADSPYLFIVKVQPLLRGIEEEDFAAEQLNFAFTSEEDDVA